MCTDCFSHLEGGQTRAGELALASALQHGGQPDAEALEELAQELLQLRVPDLERGRGLGGTHRQQCAQSVAQVHADDAGRTLASLNVHAEGEVGVGVGSAARVDRARQAYAEGHIEVGSCLIRARPRDLSLTKHL
jgi:hypothetical protein